MVSKFRLLAVLAERLQGTATAAAEKPILRFGLTEVFNPPPSSPALVDFVFVHGLNGDPKKTWTSKETKVFWPRDLLPQFTQDQRGRVLVYGYDADVASLGGAGASKDKIHNHAERLVADLFANRRIRKATERPIIFIAHSLGGLVVKRALIWSSEVTGAKIEHLRSIYVSTYGILFLGTPHKGSDLGKWGTYLSWLCQAVLPNKLVSSESQLIEALQTNSETLLNIDRQFAQLMDDFHIFFFHEAKPTNLKGTLRYIVDEESAAPLLPDVERAGIQADHSHMCTFDDASTPGFDLVIDGIQRYADHAPGIIRSRWVTEKQERLSRAVRKAKETYNLAVPDAGGEGGSRDQTPRDSVSELVSARSTPNASLSSETLPLQSQKPPEPYFIVPPGFRANTVFVGMENELRELDRRLFDPCRRDGTTCVLLYGQPGAGKTHVARQYVYKNRSKFQGGVFWINARLMEEVYRDFWQIHQKLIAKTSPEYVHHSAENIGRDFVDDVSDWFSNRQEWLLVFDGISIENEKDIDTLQRFVPDSPNCGIIYVSRSRRLENMQRLLRPFPIKIAGLNKQDGQTLLFKEMNIRNPTASQIKAAKALVKKVGGLPLAISAIARRLSDTHEPIEKFNLKSYSDDLNLGATYQHIMRDLQKNGHREAVNLMNIICFLGPHIPVEMIHLGLRALRQEHIDVRASEQGSHGDLNTTLGILMRHALIDRNEPDDSESLSSSQDGIVEPEPIDVLNVHAVIQKYWCDSLNAGKQLPPWLRRAIRLLTTSFQEADRRISQQEKPSRVSDYRWYLVHARRLKGHCIEYESRHQRLGELKVDVDAAISRIEAEIKAREPSSSQESLSQVEFQVSIFDRTISSSSSGHSQESVGDSAPSPRLRDGDDPFVNTGLIESPTGTYGASRLAQTDPNVQYPIAYSYPMQRDLSGSTVRPTSTGMLLADANSDSPSQTTRATPRRSDSFRSRSAVPIIFQGHAVGMLATAPSNPRLQKGSASLDARSSLTYLYSLCPPRLKEGPITSSPRPESNIDVRDVSPHLQSPICESSTSMVGSHSGSRPNTDPEAASYPTSPQSAFIAPEITRGSMSAEGPLSPFSMSRDNSDQGQTLAPGPDTAIYVQPAVVVGSRGLDSLALLETRFPRGTTASQPATFLGANNESLQRLATSAVGDFERAMPLPRTVRGTHTYAPHSDPLPAVDPLPRRVSGPTFRRESVPAITVEGLGISEFGDELSSVDPSAIDARERPDIRRQVQLRRAARSGAFLNRSENERPGSDGDIQEAGFEPRAVSFATPSYLQPQFNPYHQRANGAVESYDQALWQVQAMQQRQAQQPIQYPVALVSSPSLASLGTDTAVSSGLVHSAILPQVGAQQGTLGAYGNDQVRLGYLPSAFHPYGTASRSSAPFTPVTGASDANTGTLLIPTSTQRRRTLSAPESPGVGASGQKRLWSQ